MPHATPEPRDEYSELRAQIWRLAADPMLTEEQVIQQVLDLVGPALNVSRTCFNRQHGTFFTCKLEWCAPGVKSSIGTSMPVFLARHLLKEPYAELTLDNVLEYFPVTLRPLAWPLLRGLAIILDLRAVYMVSYRLGGKIEGCLTFDICNNHERGKPWTNAEKFLVFEVAQIVASITGRKRAEASLRESEERYRRLFEESNDAIFIHDLEGKIIDVNPQACSMLRCSRDRLLKMRIHDLHLPENGNDTSTAFARTRETGSTRFESRFMREDGSLIMVEVSARIMDREKGIVQGIVRDITEKKEMENQLRQAEKMQAIGELAGGIAHDFNNRLVGILGFAQLLEQEIIDPRLKDYTSRIVRGSQRAKNLTGQLLAFARKGDYQAVTVDLHRTIDEVIMFLEHTLHKRIHVRRRFKSPSPFTRGDPAQLQNIFLNLALNARDAMPDGGELVFATRNLELDKEYCRNLPYELAPGPYVMITVSDTGMGMDEATRKHVFEPFFTTKKRGEGTGMGLAAVYGTVKNHNGAIEVRSEPGRGTVFTISLPLDRETHVQHETEHPFVATSTLARILVVDDEEDVLDFVRVVLERAGWEVKTMDNGKAAVEYFQVNAGNIDLVLLDMLMPDMDGMMVFRALRRIDPKVKIIIASGYSDQVTHEPLDDGVDAFISKPFDVNQLCNQVQDALKKA